jgi:choline dehydrogenase
MASPKLLMLSGIGPADALTDMGIEVKLHAPGVGRNLQEHPGILLFQHVNIRTLNTEVTPLRIVLHGLNFLFRGRGPATTSIGHGVAFIRDQPDAPAPTLQLAFSPIAYDFTPEGVRLYRKPAVMIAVNVCRPNGRGEIRLRSPDPFDSPVIDHQLLADEGDLQKLIYGGRAARKIFGSHAFSRYSIDERLPGRNVETDAQWTQYVKDAAFPMYHPCGTCRMGPDDRSVVSEDLRVKGISGLRVVDASIMPVVPSANTNVPTIMVAERASDLILNNR